MGFLPYLDEISTSRDMISAFYGYNHNHRTNDGEFFDMDNLSSDKYPSISPRKPRGYAKDGTGEKLSIQYLQSAMAKGDKLITIEDGQILKMFDMADSGGVKEGTEPKIVTHLDLDSGEKTIINHGAYVIILPDKKYINTLDTDDYGEIENTVTTSGSVVFSMCQKGGYTYDKEITTASVAPETPENGDYWLDTANGALKRWNEVKGEWLEVASSYIKIAAAGIASGFKAGDGVTIDGIPEVSYFMGSVRDGAFVLDSVYRDEENGYTGDYIVVTGVMNSSTFESALPVTVSRSMPDMDYIVSAGNRLWGCKFGKVGNTWLNEIYCSKLGDFTNWNCFEGISTDSYTASCGSEGEFTGAAVYGGRPIFFKENCMHIVYGSYPAEFQITETACRGVQSGCHKSIATVNEILYYKARAGIMAYDGSLPVEVSSQFGDAMYDEAVACGHKNKLYVFMTNAGTCENSLFVYDTKRGLWHKESGIRIHDLCVIKDEIYYTTLNSFGELGWNIYTLLGSGITEETVDWEAETGLIGLSHPDHKYISRIDVRLSMEYGSEVSFYIKYDVDSKWEKLYTAEHKYDKKLWLPRRRTFSIPLRTRRCDHFRLKIVGKGDVEIFSISKTVEYGNSLKESGF